MTNARLAIYKEGRKNHEAETILAHIVQHLLYSPTDFTFSFRETDLNLDVLKCLRSLITNNER